MRGEVALALGNMGGDEAIQALLGALRDDASSQVRWRAALALRGTGDASIVADLEEALAAEPDESVREGIQEAIDRLT